MKNHLILVAAFAGLVGCGTVTTTDAGVTVDSGTPAPDFSTSSKILAYLEGKTMVMAGTDIPSYPNGFNENLDLGAYTQCYHKVSIATLAGNFTVTTETGQFNKADSGVIGMCNHAVKAAALTPATTTAILIENVKDNGGCFDITVTYSGYAQSGRGKISADGKTVTLELYLPTAAVSANRCADGAVGSKPKQTYMGALIDFNGNAQQTYRVQ